MDHALVERMVFFEIIVMPSNSTFEENSKQIPTPNHLEKKRPNIMGLVLPAPYIPFTTTESEIMELLETVQESRVMFVDRATNNPAPPAKTDPEYWMMFPAMMVSFISTEAAFPMYIPAPLKGMFAFVCSKLSRIRERRITKLESTEAIPPPFTAVPPLTITSESTMRGHMNTTRQPPS